MYHSYMPQKSIVWMHKNAFGFTYLTRPESFKLYAHYALHLRNNTIQYNTIQYNTIQYNTTEHNKTQHSPIQYNERYFLVLRENLKSINRIRTNCFDFFSQLYIKLTYILKLLWKNWQTDPLFVSSSSYLN